MRLLCACLFGLFSFQSLCEADITGSPNCGVSSTNSPTSANGGCTYYYPVGPGQVSWAGDVTPSSASLSGSAASESAWQDLDVSANLSAVLTTVGPVGPGFVTFTFTSTGAYFG